LSELEAGSFTLTLIDGPLPQSSSKDHKGLIKTLPSINFDPSTAVLVDEGEQKSIEKRAKKVTHWQITLNSGFSDSFSGSSEDYLDLAQSNLKNHVSFKFDEVRNYLLILLFPPVSLLLLGFLGLWILRGFVVRRE